MSAHSDVDAQLERVVAPRLPREQIMRCEVLKESEVREICFRAREILINEKNIEQIDSPVTVCGDIHGQFFDLKVLFCEGGDCPKTNYVFLGDYVDRGYHCLETFLCLLLLKIRFPDCITLLRGNHESRQITQTYGFYDECLKKYGSASVWRYCTDIFDYLTISAVIDGKIFCVHGGLSPSVQTLGQVEEMERIQEVPHEGPFCDLLWSDPEPGTNDWELSQRGAGYIFGERPLKEFNHINGLSYICRAHQLVMEGYEWLFSDHIVTVWSAPNYCYRCGNVASIMKVNGTERSKLSFKIFREAPESAVNVPETIPMPDYFL